METTSAPPVWYSEDEYISIEKELPPTTLSGNSLPVVCLVDKGIGIGCAEIGWYDSNSKQWFVTRQMEPAVVTHWLRLPKTPTEKE